MKLYIAGHNQQDAIRVADSLRRSGHTITSTWLTEDFSKTSSYTEDNRRRIAIKDVTEVSGSDALVLLSSPYRVPGGKFVEVGVALGLFKPVFVIGVRENMLIWHHLVSQYDCVERLIEDLSK